MNLKIEKVVKEFSRLVETVAKLRDPNGGCPWDLEQTHKTLLPYLIEESYEYIYAVENELVKDQQEELGDVLLQVVLNSQVAQDEKKYDLAGVCRTIADKLIHRHPHVFESKHKKFSKDEVEENWKKLKKKEKKELFSDSLLKNPSLLSSYKIGKRSEQVDFDWDDSQEVWEKVEEEFNEVQEAISQNEVENIEEELGDLFFTLSQYCRHIGKNPEDVARKANSKFLNRMKKIELLANKRGQYLENLNREEKEDLWKEVKKNEK